MQVKQIMTSNVDYLGPKSTLRDVAVEMLNHDFGFIPLKANKKLVGVVTDRDLAIRAFAKGLSPESTVEKIMTKNVYYVHDNDDLSVAAKLMENKKVRRLIVLNQKDEPVGVISLGDIATECHDLKLSGEIIERVSEK